MRTALVHHWLTAWGLPVDYTDAVTGAIVVGGSSTESWGLDYTDTATGAITATGTGTDNYQPPAAYTAKVGTFQLNTAAVAGTTQAITGLGFAPTAVLFFTSGTTTEGFATSEQFSYGWAVKGASIRQQASGMSVRHGSTPESNVALADGKAIWLPTSAGVADINLSVITFDTDGFTVRYFTTPLAAHIIGYLALGGTAQFAANRFVNAAGNQAITGVGFQPDAVLLMHCTGAGASTSASPGSFALGIATTPSTQYTVTGGEAATTGNTKAHQQQAPRLLLRGSGTAGDTTNNQQADLASMDADGFTINWTVATGVNFAYLAIKGGAIALGTSQQPTTPGQTTLASTVAPGAVLMLGCNAPANTAKDATKQRLSLGASDGTNTISLWGQNIDNVATATAYKAFTTTKTFRHATQPNVIDAEATATFDPDGGIVLDWTTADTTPREFIYITVGEPATPGAGDTYNDSQSGTITATGSGVEVYEPPGTDYTDTQTGVITAAGTALESAAAADANTGAITASGIALETAAGTDSRTGAITATGTALETGVYTDAQTATAAASGTGTDNWTLGYTDTATGQLTATGNALETAETADASTGTLTATGSGTETYEPGETAYTDAATGTPTLTGTGSETYQPAGETTYTDATTGSLVASGTALENTAANDFTTATATASGSGIELYQPPAIHTDTTAGVLTATGTAADSHTHANAPIGVIAATGTSLEAATRTSTQTGTVALTGTNTENATYTYNDAAAGTVHLAGTSTDLWHPPGPQHVDAATGQLVLTGTSLEHRTYEDTQNLDATLQGTSQHTATYADTCPGTIRTHGTGTLTLTRQRLRTGHPATNQPIPPNPAWPTPGTHPPRRRGTHPTGPAGPARRDRTPA